MNGCSAFLAVLVVCLLTAFVFAQTQATSQLEVQVRYTGKEKVDADHKLYVVLYESPKLIGSGKQPLAIAPADLTTRAAKFQNIGKSRVYVIVAFSPQTVWHAGKPDEESPPGAIFTVYEADAPEAVSLAPGKTTNITVPLDDSKRVPPDRLTQLAWKEQLLPRHSMAEAIQYALSQWKELNVFATDGAIPIDNNVSEREMKRVVLTRKNSWFVGNPCGGRTAAILASLPST